MKVDVGSKVGMATAPSSRRDAYSVFDRTIRESLSSDFVHFSNDRCRSRFDNL